jgi:hypothetical protein
MIMGANGIPSIKDGGNVLRPYTRVRCSIRTPPTFDSIKNGKMIILDKLTKDPPFNCDVTADDFEIFNGVIIKDPSDKLKNTLNSCSKNYLTNETAFLSIGASIPFTSILQLYYPNSQLIVTGAAGWDSNPHGQNERLNLSYCKKFICTFAQLISNYKNYI